LCLGVFGGAFQLLQVALEVRLVVVHHFLHLQNFEVGVGDDSRIAFDQSIARAEPVDAGIGSAVLEVRIAFVEHFGFSLRCRQDLWR
jgi:hypothetical protein